VVAVLYEVDVSDLDQSDRRQSHPLLTGQVDALPACPGMTLEWAEVVIKVVGTVSTTSDPIDRHCLNSGIAAVVYLQLSLDICQL
jgi:hypothetical protein